MFLIKLIILAVIGYSMYQIYFRLVPYLSNKITQRLFGEE